MKNEMEHDINKELSKKMQEGWNLYFDDAQIPDPDLSFLKEPIKKQKKQFHYLAKVAVVVIAILVTGSAIGIWFNSESAYGGKGIIQNFKHMLSPDEQPQVDENGSTTMEITKWKDIKLAKSAIPKLYYPAYVPQDFVFDSLQAENSSSFTSMQYLFSNDKADTLLITINRVGSDGDTYVRGEKYESPISGKDLLVYFNEGTETYLITYIDGDYVFLVDGCASKEESVKIVEKIQLMD